jgi:hypothetical protein
MKKKDKSNSIVYPFKSISVAGVARNCGNCIVSDIKHIQKALTGFLNVQFFIVESDSDDDTVEKLEYLKSTIKNFHYVTLGKLKNKIPKRTERIAFCRNRYLEEFENNMLFANSEYVLISDLDGTNELLDKKGILSCLEIGNWDVCTANQLGLYYDIWAFRHPLISPNDCWKVYSFMTNELGLKVKSAKRKAFKSRMFWIKKSVKPFEVDSAFGGLAIYKRHVLTGIRYKGVDENGTEVCEHVALNKQIKEKGGKIYINPKLINCYPPTQYVKSGFKKMLLKLNHKLLFNQFQRF